MTKTAFLCLTLTTLTISATAGDWTQFRGPGASGIADTTHLPVRFGPGVNEIWRTPLPDGHSSPVLSADRIFLTAHEDKKLYTICLNRETGRILWKREAPRRRESETHRFNNPAAPTPVTDPGHVYSFFGDAGLFAYDLDGAEQWALPLGPFNNSMGMSASPVLADGKLLLACDQDENSYLMALDPSNGEIVWKTDRGEYLRGFATPVVHRPSGAPAQIILPGSFGVAGYALDTGKKLWWARGLAWQIKTVAVVGDNLIYAHGWASGGDSPASDELPAWERVLALYDAGGDGAIAVSEAFLEKMKKNFGSYDLDQNGQIGERDWYFARAKHSARNALMAVRTDGRGDVTDTHVAWRHRKPLPNVASPLLYDGVIYLAKDGGIFASVDASTGALHKAARLPDAMGNYFASPVAGDGKIFTVDTEGMVTVIRPGPKWEILAANDLGAPVYTTPALADGRIYIRTTGHLYCFGE